MQFSMNKTKTAAAITMVLLMASTMLMASVPVKAQLSATQPTAGPLSAGVTPTLTVTPIGAYLSVTPSLIGVGQPLLVNVWMVPPLPLNRAFIKAYVVTVMKPDGTKDTFGPLTSFQGDTTAYFNYVPSTIGTYKFNFDFLGEYFPAGRYYNGYIVTNSSGTAYDSAYFQPASAPEVDITVQSALVASWPPAPFPTDYWTRPAYSENREWWPILGNYPSTGVVGGGSEWDALYPNTNIYMSSYNFVPYVQAPNSAHVVWKQKYGIGGVIGSSKGGINSFVLETLAAYPTIAYAGRIYETVTKVSPTGTGSQSYWDCYDLRTGELYWERMLYSGETAPTLLTYEPGGGEVLGAEVFAATWAVYLVAITSPSGSTPGRIVKYSPWTGAVVVNITGPPQGVSAGTFYADPWVLSVQTINAAAGQYRLINWTIANNAGVPSTGSMGTQPVVDNFTARIWGNITWPFSSLGTVDYEAGVAVSTGSIISNATGNAEGVFLMGASLTTGQLLYNVTLNAATGYNEFSGIDPIADHGKYATRNRDGSYYCFDIYSGKFLWKSPMPGWPWGVFESYAVQSAYGYIYTNSYAGVQAIDWNTGKVVWQFTAPTPYSFETPYEVNGTGVYSWHSAGFVADGKLYTWNNEHTPSEPITRGWRLFCINATTGQNIWNISASSNVAGGRTFPGVVADGYLTFSNSYDAYMYVFGKGKSAATVSAPDTAVGVGTPVLIKGTVLDQSPAQPETPCVSHDSMTTQMEYLHMQHPINGLSHNVTMTGVPVTLTAIGSDGTVTNIGTTTTEAYSGTFRLAWTPPKEDTYTIVASFAGDDSYGSSSARTGLLVAPPPAATPTPTPPATQVLPDTTPYIIGMGIAIIIAVAIATILLLRKRP